jgi:hypothetical protein
MDRVIIAVVLAAVVVAVGVLYQRRRGSEAPTQRRWAVPDQLDREDFESPGSPWLIAVFTSATCDSCAEAVAKAGPLASDTVAVQEVQLGTQRDLHRRYNIEAVPTLVVADAEGVVRASFVGPPPAGDLWATVAEVRDGGRSAS